MKKEGAPRLAAVTTASFFVSLVAVTTAFHNNAL
jgi:hypothetical protein